MMKKMVRMLNCDMLFQKETNVFPAGKKERKS